MQEQVIQNLVNEWSTEVIMSSPPQFSGSTVYKTNNIDLAV